MNVIYLLGTQPSTCSCLQSQPLSNAANLHD